MTRLLWTWLLASGAGLAQSRPTGESPASAPSTTEIQAALDRLDDADATVRSAARQEIVRWLDSPWASWVARHLTSSALMTLLDELGERALAAADPETRRELAWHLSMIGRQSLTVLPWLLRLLRETTDPNTRLMALDSIRQLGPAAAEAVPEVIAVLASPDASLRQRTLGTLGGLGGPAALAAIADRIAAPDQYERYAALRALAYQGTAAAATVPRILPLMHHQHVATVTVAIETLVRIGDGSDAVRDAFGRVLLHRHEDVRLAAVHGIAQLALSTPTIAARLGDLLRDESTRVAEASGIALVLLGGPSAREVLDEAARHVDPGLRSRASELLAAFAGDAPRLRAVVTALSHADEPVRLAALDALARQGADSQGAGRDLVIAELSRQTESASHPLRVRALRLLAPFWPHASENVRRVFAQHLARGLVFEDAFLRDGEAALLALQVQCRSAGPLRNFAVRMLGRLGGRAAAALPELQILAGDADPALADLARTAITAIRGATISGPASSPAMDRLAVPELVRTLESADPAARATALAILSRSASAEVVAAVPAVLPCLAAGDDAVQAEALRFLVRHGGRRRELVLDYWSSCPPHARMVAGLLVRAISDGEHMPASLARAACAARHPFVRETAVRMLGRVADEDERTRLCRAGLRDPVASVRKAATQAAPDAPSDAVALDLLSLLDDDEEVAMAALFAGHRLGTRGRPLALAALDRSHSRFQYQGAFMLTAPGVARSEDRVRLRGLLAHPDLTILARVAESLGGLGPGSDDAETGKVVARLRTLVLDPSAEVVVGAARGLAGFGGSAKSAAPDALTALAAARRQKPRSTDTEVALLEAFGAIAPAPLALAEAVHTLESAPDAPLVRAAAVRVIARRGRGARDLLPMLRAELRSDRRAVEERVVALQAIGTVAADADPATATAALEVILEAAEGTVTVAALRILVPGDAYRANLTAALGQIGPGSLPELARRVADRHAPAAARELLAIAVEGVAGRDASALVRLLGSESKPVRDATVMGIAELARAGRQVSAPIGSADQLASRLSDLVGHAPDAGLALVALGDTGTRAIGRMLATPGGTAAVVLRDLQGRMSDRPQLVPLLVRHWHDQQAARREIVVALVACGAEGIRAIERLDVGAELAWAALLGAARGGPPATSTAALRALSRYEPSPQQAGELLAVVTSTRDPRSLGESLPLLRRISLPDIPGAARHLLPLLLAGLVSDAAATRVMSARAVGAVGREGLEALPYLREALADDDAAVRAAAAAALVSLGAPAERTGR